MKEIFSGIGQFQIAVYKDLDTALPQAFTSLLCGALARHMKRLTSHPHSSRGTVKSDWSYDARALHRGARRTPIQLWHEGRG